MVDVNFSKKVVSTPEVVQLDDDSRLADESGLSSSSVENLSAGSVLFTSDLPSAHAISTPSSSKGISGSDSPEKLRAEISRLNGCVAKLKSEKQKLYNRLNQATRDKKCSRYCSREAKFKDLLTKKLEKFAFVERSELQKWDKLEDSLRASKERVESLIEKGEENLAKALNGDR